jgi:hypothetical protein
MEMMAIAASICSVEFQILNQLMVGSQKDNDGAERDCLGQTGCAFSFQLPIVRRAAYSITSRACCNAAPGNMSINWLSQTPSAP